MKQKQRRTIVTALYVIVFTFCFTIYFIILVTNSYTDVFQKVMNQPSTTF